MPTKNMNWRSYVKVHPAADLFPMMGQENLQALSDDIRANGLRVPVVYFAARNGERLLLDGRNRLAAMALAGKKPDAVSSPSSTEPVISDSTPTSDMPAAVVEDSNISTAPSQTSEQTATIEAGHETDASPINGGEATIIAVIATESDQALRQLHLLAEFTKQVDDANDRMITAYATRSLDDASEALLSAVEAAKGFIERAAVESAAH